MQTRREQIPPQYMDDIRQMIINGPNFKLKIEQIEDTVYQKHNIIDRKVFERVTQELAERDVEIKQIMQKIKTLYVKALDGQSQEFDGVIPLSITSEMLLDLRK